MLEQPLKGYRFNLDAPLLAAFAYNVGVTVGASPRQIVDLGAGCGVIGILLARRWTCARLELVEIQPALAALAARNLARNGLADRGLVRCGDLLQARRLGVGPADLVVCNPPYHRVGRGAVSRDREVAIAKHEIACDLPGVLRAAAALLLPAGMLALVHAASRLTEVLERVAAAGLEPCVVRPVHPRPGAPANRVLVAATWPLGRGTRELPPLYVEEEEVGCYSREAKEILHDACG